jgi:hypothetical protein
VNNARILFFVIDLGDSLYSIIVETKGFTDVVGLKVKYFPGQYDGAYGDSVWIASGPNPRNSACKILIGGKTLELAITNWLAISYNLENAVPKTFPIVKTGNRMADFKIHEISPSGTIMIGLLIREEGLPPVHGWLRKSEGMLYFNGFYEPLPVILAEGTLEKGNCVTLQVIQFPA